MPVSGRKLRLKLHMSSITPLSSRSPDQLIADGNITNKQAESLPCLLCENSGETRAVAKIKGLHLWWRPFDR